MEAKYSLRPGTALVDWDTHNALFYRFGNRILVSGLPENFAAENFFKFLKTPRDISDIQTHAPGLSQSETQALLQNLMANGLLELSDSMPEFIEPSPWAQYVKRFFNVESAQVAALKRLHETPVRFFSLDKPETARIYTESLSGLLGNLKYVTALEELEANSFAIIQGSWRDVLKLSRVNKEMLAKRQKWLLCLSDEHGGSIGPRFGFENGPCFDCLVQRRNLHLPHVDKQILMDKFFDEKDDFIPCALPNVHETLANTLTIEIFRIIAEIGLSRTVRGLYEFDFLNHRQSFHDVLALPYCESCSQYVESPAVNLETI